VALIFWEFIYYSFLGYLVEKAYARATGAEKQTRKCLLLLPLCPVYGLAMAALLAMPEPLLRSWRVIVTGAVVTTAVEYGVHWAYEALLHVHFWDYTGVRGNLKGRVCLPFTLAWGALSAVAVWLFQPLLLVVLPFVSPWVTLAAMLLFTADAVCSARLLWVTGDTETLRLSALRG
jgi:uncharacterized membrane protein